MIGKGQKSSGERNIFIQQPLTKKKINLQFENKLNKTRRKKLETTTSKLVNKI